MILPWLPSLNPSGVLEFNSSWLDLVSFYWWLFVLFSDQVLAWTPSHASLQLKKKNLFPVVALSAFISWLLNKMFVRLHSSASSFSLRFVSLYVCVVAIYCFSCSLHHVAYQFIFGAPRFWAMPLFLITSLTCYLIILASSHSKKNWAFSDF